MKNSFSSDDQITIQLKTKTNSSGLYQYSHKQLTNSINDERPDNTIQTSTNNNREGRLWYGSSVIKMQLHKKKIEPNVMPEVILQSSHPLSPNSKRLQQLQLFRFDEKIEEIQSQQIQQLINQQVKASQDKNLKKISQLLSKSPIHPKNSNAFRLFKRPFNRLSKGINHPNEKHSRYGNKTCQENELANAKIGFFGARNDAGHKMSEMADHIKEGKSIIVHEGKKTEGDLQKSRTENTFKTTATLPVWQRNIFHEKIISRQNQSKKSTNKTYFSSTFQKSPFFNGQPKNSTEQPQKLSEIQESLTFFKNKSFSVKKNYEFFISKLNQSNPEVQQQLIDQLKKSKMNQRILLDNNCKSFSGYCKTKSYMYNKGGVHEKMMAEMMRERNEQGNDLYRNVANVTSYKFSHLKPLKIRQSKKNKNQLLLFEESPEPKVSRCQLNQVSDESQNEEDESEYEISPKFRELYKEKHDEKEIEKYIAERKRISRESSSPYHELSAWN